MPAVSPMTDDRHHLIGQITLTYYEIGAVEESSHSRTQQQRADHSVQHQKELISTLAQPVSQFRLKLIRHRLQHKAEKDNHPQPVSPSKTGAVEQRERSKESSSKSDQSCEGKFPFTSCGVHKQSTFVFCTSQAIQQRVSSLHKQQKHQQCTQQRNQEPPVMLQEYIS